MALCSAVITSALKKLGIASASTAEISDALPHLQALYNALVNGGAFGRFRDVVVTANYTAFEQDRIFVNTASAVTITIPDTFDRTTTPFPYELEDVSTSGVNSDIRPARDLAAILVTTLNDATAPATWIRDGYQGIWVRIDGLTTSSTAPLSDRDFDGMACYLATLLADEYSDRDVNPRTALGAARFLTNLTHKTASPRKGVHLDFF